MSVGDVMAAIGNARQLIVSQIERTAQLKAALRDLVELWDHRDQGQWSWAELQRLDEIRELARPDTYTPAGPPPEVKPCDGIAPEDRLPCALPLGHVGPHSHRGPFRNS